MAPHFRARRRNQRQAQNRLTTRANPTPPDYSSDEADFVDSAVDDATLLALAESEVNAELRPTKPSAATSTSSGRFGRRGTVARIAPEPVDYSKDYAAVRRDLLWITLWSVLLFGGMIALRFSGLV
jgi:hypothetical protein